MNPGDIKISANFAVSTEQFIDGRMTVADVAALSAFEFVPDGFETFVRSENTWYVYNKAGNSWGPRPNSSMITLNVLAFQEMISEGSQQNNVWYQVTNAVGNTRTLLIVYGSISVDGVIAYDVRSGEIGRWKWTDDSWILISPIAGGGVASVTGLTVDNTDPSNPVVNALGLSGYNYVVCESVEEDPVASGANLLAAYTAAKALDVGTKSATNRAVVLVMPGLYDLEDGTLTLDESFVDIVGVSSNRADLVITSTENVIFFDEGVNASIENLTCLCTSEITDVADTTPVPLGWEASSVVRVRNGFFNNINTAISMRYGIDLNGDFKDVECVNYGFGVGADITVTGRYEDCIGGGFAFGYNATINNATYINCTATDSAFGANITDSTFINCKSGQSSFGYLESGDLTISGTFIDCAASISSFGHCLNGSIIDISATFKNCVATSNSFGFAYNNITDISGSFEKCIATTNSFGSAQTGNITDISGSFKNCKADSYSFGHALIGGISDISGSFTNCAAGIRSFGHAATLISGTFDNITMGDYWLTSFGGKLKNTTITAESTDVDGITNVLAGATFENCHITANGTGKSLNSVSGGNITVKFSQFNSAWESTLINLLSNDTTTDPMGIVDGQNILDGVTFLRYGAETFTFDGVATIWTIAHGLGATPTSVSLTSSDGANTDFNQGVITLDATDITITCASPPSGSLVAYWQVFR